VVVKMKNKANEITLHAGAKLVLTTKGEIDGEPIEEKYELIVLPSGKVECSRIMRVYG
jgi:hypothetical protein